MQWQAIPADWQWYREGLKQMMAAVRGPIKQGVEVGLGWGVSANFFLEHNKAAKLLSFDVNPGLPAIAKLAELFPGRWGYADPAWWKFTQVPPCCQWLYIDGGHEYEEVKADLALYEPWLEVGGVIAFDDYESSNQFQYPGVKQAVDEFMNFNPGRYTELLRPKDLPLETGPVFAVKISGV